MPMLPFDIIFLKKSDLLIFTKTIKFSSSPNMSYLISEKNGGPEKKLQTQVQI